MREKNELIQEYWIKIYQMLGALWIHDGNPKRPHALLTAGDHSNGFFNSRLVIPSDELMGEAVLDLLELFAVNGGDIEMVNGITGPQTGATKLANFISTQITTYTRRECFYASPAKSEIEGKKSMVFSNEELELLPGQTVLLCEDVITTGGSIELTEMAIFKAEGIILPYILTLVNRSGLTEVHGRKIIALINQPMPKWEKEDCPLCQEGSEAIPAKDTANWARLNAAYETKGEA